jgi:hypothetical protein
VAVDAVVALQALELDELVGEIVGHARHVVMIWPTWSATTTLSA